MSSSSGADVSEEPSLAYACVRLQKIISENRSPSLLQAVAVGSGINGESIKSERE